MESTLTPQECEQCIQALENYSDDGPHARSPEETQAILEQLIDEGYLEPIPEHEWEDWEQDNPLFTELEDLIDNRQLDGFVDCDDYVLPQLTEELARPIDQHGLDEVLCALALVCWKKADVEAHYGKDVVRLWETRADKVRSWIESYS